MALALQEKAAGATANGQQAYASGGIFATPGLDSAVFSAIQLPIAGLFSKLVSIGSVMEYNSFSILTGQAANAGSNPTNPCDPAKRPGDLSAMEISLPFGRLPLDSQTYDASSIGSVAQMGINTELKLVNAAKQIGLMPGGTGNIPMSGFTARDLMLFKMGVGYQYEFARLLYTGNPANNTGGGGYKEPYGLQALVNTGYRDATTTTAAQAIDPIVTVFNKNFSGDANSGNALQLFYSIVGVYHEQKRLGFRVGLAPQFAFDMAPSMFYELANIWSCIYATGRCTAIVGNGNMAYNPQDGIKLRDEMIQGSYLLIDGEQVEVIQDDVIPFTVTNGVYQSDIYLLPMFTTGGVPALYLEYFDFNNPNAINEFKQMPGAISNAFDVSDGGRFLWNAEWNNWCFVYHAVTKYRLLLRVPFLAARWTNVQYTPSQAPRGMFPGDPGYVAGGVTVPSQAWLGFSSPTA